MTELIVGQIVACTNPKFADLGWGYIQKTHGNKVKVEFVPTIFNKPPYDRRVKIISQEEIRTVKRPFQRLEEGDFEETWRFELKQRAAHLIVCNRDGQLSNSLTDLMPHQITVAHSVVTGPKRRFLIADEVGLGKTIEAGLVILVLLQRGLAKRVLIVPPAGLTIQWQEELEEKFGLDFLVYGEEVQGVNAFNTDRLIASLETLRLDTSRKQGRLPGHKTLILESKPWDIIIFDEAHRLTARAGAKKKIAKTLAYKLADELQTRCDSLLLLTGTPHQGDQPRFEFLMQLIDKDVTFAKEPDKPAAVPYTQLILRNQKSKVTDAEGNPIFKGIKISPAWVQLRDSGEKAFHEALEAYLREGYGYADREPGDKQHRAIGFVMTIFQKMAASSTAAIRGALANRVKKITGKDTTSPERPALREDERFAGEMEEQAVALSSEDFFEKELQMIQRLLKMKVPEDGKIEELFEVIEAVSTDDPVKKVLIFTEYRGTLDFIVKHLEKKYGAGCTTIIKGGMGLGAKARNQKAFKEDRAIRFMVSTEAGGEGINLQFSHIMINYDMPWNPFRLAQRYGRLYRYGQKEVVQAFNFSYKDTIESLIREYLEQKTRTAAKTLCKITGETISDIELSLLGQFEGQLDYDKLYREAMIKRDVKPAKETINKALPKIQDAYKKGYEMLKNVGQFNPDRFREHIKSPLDLNHVNQFISEFVSHHAERSTPYGDLLDFQTPSVLISAKVRRKYHAVTFDREKAMNESVVRLEFMAMGHPFTDAAIKYAGGAEMGGFAATRQIMDHRFSGSEGIHFNFMVKRKEKADDREEIVFDLVPIFLAWDGALVEGAGEAALEAWGTKAIAAKKLVFHKNKVKDLFEAASAKVREKYQDEEFWDDDIVCLNAAVTRFV